MYVRKGGQPDHGPRLKINMVTSLLLNVLEKLSAKALSQQLPLRPHGRSRHALHGREPLERISKFNAGILPPRSDRVAGAMKE